MRLLIQKAWRDALPTDGLIVRIVNLGQTKEVEIGRQGSLLIVEIAPLSFVIICCGQFSNFLL